MDAKFINCLCKNCLNICSKLRLFNLLQFQNHSQLCGIIFLSSNWNGVMLPRMLVTLPALRKQLESLSFQKPPSVIAIFVKHSIFDVICRSLGRASRWLCHAKSLNHQPKPSWKSLVLTWCNWQVLDMDVFLANKRTVTHFFFFKTYTHIIQYIMYQYIQYSASTSTKACALWAFQKYFFVLYLRV